MTNSLFIHGRWIKAEGNSFSSIQPGDGTVVWQGAAASESQVDEAVDSARKAYPEWASKSYSERESIVLKFAELLDQYQQEISEAIAKETGKPLWEAKTEAATMKGKIPLSIKAFQERTGETENKMPVGKAVIRYKPHGVVAVFGPYNFPGHLPNGHIVPALLAGNCVIFKPSELTPMIAQLTIQLWEKANIPPGVINLVQGEKDTGIHLANHSGLDGLFFTGSSNTGKLIHQQYGGQPGKILALEMGGNNPLIVDEVSNIKAAVHDTIHSAFITSGQRCTCARRLFVPEGDWGDQFCHQLLEATQKIRTGSWNDDPQPFMGALISESAVKGILQAQESLIAQGANPLLKSAQLKPNTGFISPGLIDVTAIKELPDEEYFGPLLPPHQKFCIE